MVTLVILILLLGHHKCFQLVELRTRRSLLQAGNGNGAEKKPTPRKELSNPMSEYKPTEKRENSNRWRLFDVEVSFDDDPGKDFLEVHDNLVQAITKRLSCNDKELQHIQILRKSFDGRWKKSGQPKWAYTVDVSIHPSKTKARKMKAIQGRLELIQSDEGHQPNGKVAPKPGKLTSSLDGSVLSPSPAPSLGPHALPRVIVVGAGPAGLFAAITLVEAGYKPIIIERGHPVEQRGRDIGDNSLRPNLQSQSPSPSRN